MSVYEGTKGMLKKFQNNIFERVNQLLKDRDGKIEKNASDILSNAKQASQDLDKLKKETEAQIKQLSDQVTAATDNTNELKKTIARSN
ncbi:hypothetical protein EfsSVR2330_33440 (plasmid) [Enterococcus faecalis]|uniref:hypothetical protein n=1 Tax=Enterococcus faecalis TaxID=1351 RepID=UPI0023042136|nr:hypothetical protein [Enterococcus faecalis]BDQ55833.1 hypothetical protein EfsSVR2330_33440 [Enterococcus faecalis]